MNIIKRKIQPVIAYQLKSFPNVSETFVVSNIIYAINREFKVQLYVNKYLAFENSSQADILKRYDINSVVHAPKIFSDNKFIRWGQLAVMALHPRVFPFVLKYYKSKSKPDSRTLLQLYQYRHFSKNTVCHVHFNNALYPLRILTEMGYIEPKVIVTFHGYDAFLENRESFQEKYGFFYEKYVKAVTVNSRYLKQQLLTLGIPEVLIHIIPIGIDSNYFKGTVKQISAKLPIKLITVGRLVQLKGHRFAIEAVKKIKDAGYNLDYTIIGAGTYLETLKTQVTEHGLTDVIHFKGKANQDEVKRALNESHIFLMPSTYDDKTGRREAFGLVSIEAQAMGLPIVGFNSGGFPDTIIEGKTGFTAEDRNVEDLTNKIVQLLENPTLYQTMSMAAIQHSATFDQNRTTQQYLDLYEALI